MKSFFYLWKFFLYRVTNENYYKLLTASVEAMFAICDENDYDVRLAAEENISRLVNVSKIIRSRDFF